MIFGVLLVTVLHLRDSSLEAQRTNQAVAAASNLETLAAQLELGLRGYLISGDPKLLRRWRHARERYPAAAKRLEQLVAGTDQEQAVRAIQRSVDDYLKTFGPQLVDFMLRNPNAAKTVISADQAEQEINNIRTQFVRFVARERRTAEARDSAAHSDARAAILVTAIGLGGLLLAVLAFAGYLDRAVARPIRRAADVAARLAKGDLSARVQERSPDEVGRLEHSFNTMAASLEQNRHDLEEQNRLLRESEQLKSELVSIVSHELRTPLASVIGFSDVMLRQNVTDADRQRYLEIIRTEASRLAELLNDLLDLQRIEEAQLGLAFQDVDIVELIRSQLALYAAQSAVHQLAGRFRDEEIHVLGDHDRLAQVLGNLLSNAIKYSPDGGVIEVTAEVRDERAVISIRDDGIGIPVDQQRQVFSKFFRGDAGRQLGIAGTGLGLALSRQIVEAHGGTIGFESREGVGSRFWIELPVEVPDVVMRRSRRRSGARSRE